MTKWLLKSGDGRLLPREVFFLPGNPSRFRKGHPGFVPPPKPQPKKPPHSDPYRDKQGRFLKATPHPYRWEPGVPRPLAHQRKSPPRRQKCGRFGSRELPPRILPPRDAHGHFCQRVVEDHTIEHQQKEHQP